MRKLKIKGLLVAAIALGCSAGAIADHTNSSISIAFVDVNVVSMNRQEVDEHQTVLVAGDRIVAIGPTAAVRVPPGARRIAGAGRYLMPGIIDMHVHFRRQPTEDDLAYSRMPDYRERNDDWGVLFIANGVTSVRMMHGHPLGDELTARSRGDWLGPLVYSTGPITDGSPPVHPYNRILTQPADAAKLVAEDKAKGYVGFKVYDNLSLPVYDAIVSAAATAHLDVVGHIPDEVSVAHAIAAHQATIEHADSFLYSLQRDNPSKAAWADTPWHDAYQRADLERLTAIADELHRAGIWTCPTIIVGQFWAPDYEYSPEMKYVPAAFRADLHKHWAPAPFEERRAFALAAVRRLHERGAGLLLGTDAYITIPGFSALQELGLFVQAGLTPYEALQTGTINAARALHEQDSVGTVDIGKRADLLLLESNPLADVANVRKLVGVSLRGRWLPQSELQGRLAAVAKSVAAL
jgi:imidazolonepropionase-like amidohydrolase